MIADLAQVLDCANVEMLKRLAHCGRTSRQALDGCPGLCLRCARLIGLPLMRDSALVGISRFTIDLGLIVSFDPDFYEDAIFINFPAFLLRSEAKQDGFKEKFRDDASIIVAQRVFA